MKIVVCSDLHMDASTAGFSRFDDANTALGQVVDHAIGVGASAFLFLGDLCDPDASNLVRCIAAANHHCRRLAANGIRSAWLAGNHDVLENGLGTTVLDPLQDHVDHWSLVMKEPSVLEIGPPTSDLRFAIACLPYSSLALEYDPEKELRKIKDLARSPVKIIATHLMLEGIEIGSETEDFPRGRDVFFPIDLAREFFPDAVIVAGHYHEARAYRGVQIVGSMLRLTKKDVDFEPRFLELEI